MCEIIEIGGVKNGQFVRNHFIKEGDLQNHLHKFNNTDVYRTVYRYENKNIMTTDFIGPFYLDLDIDDIENNFMKIKQDLMLIIRRLTSQFSIDVNDIELYFSGSKGFHILISEDIFGFEPSKDINKYYKKIATELKTYTVNKTVDTKIYDNRRLFRVVNSINGKTGLYKVSIDYDTIKEMTEYNELVRYASSPRPIINKTYSYNERARLAFDEAIERIDAEERSRVNTKLAKEFIQRKELLPCVQYILLNGCTKGNRNNTTVALANSLFQIGKDFDEVTEIIEYWNATKNPEPLDKAELRTTIRSAFTNAQQNKFYGCTVFKDLDVCVKSCPINK